MSDAHCMKRPSERQRFALNESGRRFVIGAAVSVLGLMICGRRSIACRTSGEASSGGNWGRRLVAMGAGRAGRTLITRGTSVVLVVETEQQRPCIDEDQHEHNQP